jgi:predicted acetyltransferase
MRLEQASLDSPKGLPEFLADLADGENGFSGTPVHNGESTLQEYLQRCCDQTDDSKLEPGLVPQTVFWLLNSEDSVVGMVKVRHRLAESTRINGGHIGFYVHPSHRGKGFGKLALALALVELRKIGESKALITVYPENVPSIKIVEANGGQLDDTVFDPRTEHDVNRYWIELDP